MSIANPQSLDIELPVLNSHPRPTLSDSPLDPVLQQPIQSDYNPTLEAARTLNPIDPSLPVYTPSAPTTIIHPGTPARTLEVDDELLRYTLTHDRGGIPVARLPESFPLEDGQSFRSHETFPPPYGTNEPPIYRRRIANAEEEPQTLAMLFFKFGFCTFFSFFWYSDCIICPNKIYSLSSLLGFRRLDAYHAPTLA
jgi:hypothetical protein